MNSRALALTSLLCLAGAPLLPAAEVRVAASSGAALDEWSARLERMAERGELVPLFAREDTLIPGRSHERFAQLHKGVPVFGGELVRQREGRATLTVFGTLYEGVEVGTAPALSASQAERVVSEKGAESRGAAPELLVLPLDDGGYRLAYRIRAVTRASGLDFREYFVDAANGEVVLEYSDLQAQSAGRATGVLGDSKKISTRQSGSAYVADDRLRPPSIRTYDLKGNVQKFLAWDAGAPVIGDADLASDADNTWTDGANVDAHVYVGYTYDYYFKRFGRRGLDNANISVFAFTHPIRREDIATYAREGFASALYCNAFYIPGSRVMVFGEGLPPGWTCGGLTFNYFAAGLDVVSHEYSHGVTDYSSRLTYRNESGALNEAFSDIMSTGAEFYFQDPGNGPLRADWLHAEDVSPGGYRSLQNPTAFGDPDHYSIRYVGTQDNGGVHVNSGIANHAFYLAVEGGTHRLSRVAVQGVGFSNREQIERVFYRGFTSFLTPSSDFAAARAATIQAARDLYGVSGAVERAVTQAWTAVGVN
jgi:thermolysin